MKKSRNWWALLEIGGRVSKLPMVFLVAIFAVANFIDALRFPEDSTKYSLLIWFGAVFLIGMGILELVNIVRAIQKFLGGSNSPIPAPE